MKKWIILLALIGSLSVPCFGGVVEDNVDDYITCGSGSTVDNIFDAGGTILIRFNLTAWGDISYPRLLDKSEVGGGANVGFSLYIRRDSDSAPASSISFVHYFDGTPNLGRWSTDASSISTGVDTTVMVTYDNSLTTNNPTIYINGASVNVTETTTPDGTRLDDSSLDFIIGNLATDLNKTPDVTIYEVRAYKRVLSSAEASLIHNAKLKSKDIVSATSISGYWGLDDETAGTSCDGDIFLDLSGNGNNGTGNDGANDSGLTATAESVLNYPPMILQGM